jgi:hypothetical protein
LYMIHENTESTITLSYYDTTYFETEDIRNKILWNIDETGLIFGSEKFDTNNKLLSSEKYKFDFSYSSYENLTNNKTFGKLCWIREKQKFNSSGELTETLKYNFINERSYEIHYFNASGGETRMERIN